VSLEATTFDLTSIYDKSCIDVTRRKNEALDREIPFDLLYIFLHQDVTIYGRNDAMFKVPWVSLQAELFLIPKAKKTYLSIFQDQTGTGCFYTHPTIKLPMNNSNESDGIHFMQYVDFCWHISL